MDPKEYKHIAVVGVSGDAGKFGYKIFRDLLNAGYPVKGVNPKGGFVLGSHIYKSLEELQPRPDLVITVTPPAVTAQVLEECNRLGVRTVWMQPGSESSAAAEKAKIYGIRTVSACFMARQGLW